MCRGPREIKTHKRVGPARRCLGAWAFGPTLVEWALQFFSHVFLGLTHCMDGSSRVHEESETLLDATLFFYGSIHP
jgi:hypothetical protein